MKRVIGVFCLAAILLSGCNSEASFFSKSEKAEASLFAMDTYMTITAYGKGAETTLGEAEELIRAYEALFDPEAEGSDIYKINQNIEAAADADTAELIQTALAISEDTEGALDITVYPLVKLWDFTGEAPEKPEDAEIKKLLLEVGYENVSVSGSRVTLARGAMTLGACAKGYTAQKVSDLLKDRGITSAVISLGGNVQLVGSRPDGTDWLVAVQDPDKPEGYAAVLSLSDTAAVTSGGYQRYFEQDGALYHHILDPRTGYPAESGLKSVTVVSEDGTRADCLSTALFVMGAAKARDYWTSAEGFEMLIIDDSGNMFVTEGLKGRVGDISSAYSLEVWER